MIMGCPCCIRWLIVTESLFVVLYKNTVSRERLGTAEWAGRGNAGLSAQQSGLCEAMAWAPLGREATVSRLSTKADVEANAGGIVASALAFRFSWVGGSARDPGTVSPPESIDEPQSEGSYPKIDYRG